MKAVATLVSESASANLGDQAIARALTAILEPEFSVRLVGFSSNAYQAYGEPRKKTLEISFLHRFVRIFPVIFRARIRWYLLGERKQMELRYRNMLEESTVVVIGGGQLIKNNIALFCDRLVLLKKVAHNLGLPYIFVGVGVDRNMSSLTWSLARSFIAHCGLAILRDEVSHQRILKNVPNYPRCLVLPDLVFTLTTSINTNLPRGLRSIDLGLNVMSFKTMLAQNCIDVPIDSSRVTACYTEMVICALREGATVTLFTSGAVEDYHEMQQLRVSIFEKTGVEVSVFHPNTLDELLSFLAEVRDVVAARMHAGILAYISGCNPVCLNWDDKVSGVWAAIGQETRVIELSDFSGPKSAIALAERLGHIAPPCATARTLLAERIRLEVREEIFSFLNKAGVAQKNPLGSCL